MFDLDGKVALVTGSAQGIGKAIALNLAQGGARIVLTDMREAKLDEAVKEIEAQGGKAIRFVVDVTDREAVKKVFDQVLETWEKIDILVNNAGITRDSLVMRMKVEDWQAVLKTNLDGAFYCIQAVLPGMVRQRYGRIVSIASVVAQAGNVGQANYISSKAGIIGLTKGVAAEVARHDRESAPGDQGEDAEHDPHRAHGNRRGDCHGSAFPGVGGSPLHHRACAQRQRRDVYGVRKLVRGRLSLLELPPAGNRKRRERWHRPKRRLSRSLLNS